MASSSIRITRTGIDKNGAPYVQTVFDLSASDIAKRKEFIEALGERNDLSVPNAVFELLNVADDPIIAQLTSEHVLEVSSLPVITGFKTSVYETERMVHVEGKTKPKMRTVTLHRIDPVLDWSDVEITNVTFKPMGRVKAGLKIPTRK